MALGHRPRQSSIGGSGAFRFTIAMVLVALGVVGTFPTFFQAFASD
jgi:hypothetical protein